uniref:Uncharacterized protein n=1 Tax=Anguilla anguilla TaxID=7936 RepID=A0A0E9T4J8_ANGAN
MAGSHSERRILHLTQLSVFLLSLLLTVNSASSEPPPV